MLIKNNAKIGAQIAKLCCEFALPDRQTSISGKEAVSDLLEFRQLQQGLKHINEFSRETFNFLLFKIRHCYVVDTHHTNEFMTLSRSIRACIELLANESSSLLVGYLFLNATAFFLPF